MLIINFTVIRHGGGSSYYDLNLFTLLFGLTYIFADLGGGKSAMQRGCTKLISPLGLFLANSFFGLMLGGIFSLAVYISGATALTALTCLLFFSFAAFSSAFYSKMEFAGNFKGISIAEVSQSVIYLLAFLVAFRITEDIPLSVSVSAILRILSIPISYYLLSRSNQWKESEQSMSISAHFNMTFSGLRYQMAQGLFVVKDLILLYFIFSKSDKDLLGNLLFWQSVIFMPLAFMNPISRSVFERATKKLLTFHDVIKTSLIILVFIAISELTIFILMPYIIAIFNTSLIDMRLLAILIVAVLISGSSIPLISVFSANRSFNRYLLYSTMIFLATVISGLIFRNNYPIDLAYVIAVCVGHFINLAFWYWIIRERRTNEAFG
ncbi:MULTISPECIES: hypothetical protein [unclassified Deinococcus]|uniref:hypothetical protein n=1 Tax=unclassified Deinococcus TaxID=2623546 RepID=UPI001C305E93|nr:MULTISPECIES: hypothetical protein [unclassified Deinococcus]MDK2014165.1 hypothetical protein [Deinococcus sp. 43]